MVMGHCDKVVMEDVLEVLQITLAVEEIFGGKISKIRTYRPILDVLTE